MPAPGHAHARKVTLLPADSGALSIGPAIWTVSPGTERRKVPASEPSDAAGQVDASRANGRSDYDHTDAELRLLTVVPARPVRAAGGGACGQRPVLMASCRVWAAISGTMIGLSKFTPRMWLILAHDLLATAAAVVASFFIRFEEAGLAERWRLLVVLLPLFRRLCRLRLRLLRALQGEVAVHLAARSLQHRARRDRARGDAAGARLRAAGAELLRHVLLRQDHDRRSIGCCRSRS